ncbi:GNAT family N-acetyltransferase [Halobellus sp. GM3]|uniref:GNAT family N-acetyltransferase n=1 Tax=Halobellus sp. GM3 TaxID=3458410 RepID=UPI00403D90B4
MNIREAHAEDQSEIATVARASLSESYGHFLSQETIVEVVEEWYSPERIERLLEDDAERFYVAEADDIVGFVQLVVVEADPLTAELHWLHVSPNFRGEEIGLRLLGRAQDAAESAEAAVLKGFVLEQNETGVRFYEANGFERAGARTVDIGEETYEEVIFEKSLDGSPRERVVEPVAGPDGADLFVDFSDAEHADKASFYAVYEDRDFRERYGFQCGNCDSLSVAMDSMGRIVCNRCGNKRKATRWDASYL